MKLLKTADGSLTLENTEGVAYHSREGAVAESKYVYLDASGLAARLAAGGEVRILEVGLGTGLNFVLSAMLARQYPNARLAYVAFEPNPLPTELLGSFYADADCDADFAQIVKDGKAEGSHANVGWQFCYTAWPDKELQGLFDIIYYDAFGPKDAPDMWTSSLLLHTLRFLVPGGNLVTFSVTGELRRALQDAGYACERLNGFGRKRHMLRVTAP